MAASDLIVHAGDLGSAEVLDWLESLGPPVRAVYGNVDTAAVRARLPETAEFDAAGHAIAVVHDAGAAKGRLARMRRRFPGADAVIFGHSHLPLHESEGGFQIFNPGSPTERRRAPQRSFGLAETTSNKLGFPGTSGSEFPGGRRRNMLKRPMPDPSIERFRAVISVAYSHLEERRQEINDLNVFPVADGDTGDNMALTLRHVIDKLDRLEQASVDGDPKRPEIVRAVARAALMGARVVTAPRVPNSTSRPATIATTAHTATRDERTWPLSSFGRGIFRPRYPAACGAGSLPGGAQSAQPFHQQRVVSERLGPVDQCVQHLVVPGRGHLELVPDRLLLGTGVLPPVPLEREDRAVTLGESGEGRRRSFGGAGGAGVGAVHLLLTPVRSVIVRPRSTVRVEQQRCHSPVRRHGACRQADSRAVNSGRIEGVSSTIPSVALVEELQARSREVDPLVNAICTPNPAALTHAAQLDTERDEGRVRGPLHGVPVLVKDNIDTADLLTTAGSLALSDQPPPLEDAPLVRRLREAGCVVLGKTNLSEWANFRAPRPRPAGARTAA